MLGNEITGQYLTALTYAQLFSSLADLGLSTYLIRDLNQEDEKGGSFLNEIFTLRVTSGIISTLFTFLILLFFPYTRSFTYAIYIAIISGLFMLLNSTIVAVFQAKLRMELAVISDLIGKALNVAVVYFILKHGLALIPLTTVLAVTSALTFGINMYFLKKYFDRAFAFSAKRWKKVLKQTLPIWVTAVLSLIYFRVDNILLSVLPLPHHQENFVQVSYYGTAYKYLDVLIMIPGIFLGSLFPVMSAVALKETDKFKGYLQHALNILSNIMFPILIGGYVLATPLILLIATPSYLPAASALRVLVFAFLASGFGAIFTYGTLSMNEQKRLIWPYTIATVFNIVANCLAIPRYSFMGAAYTTVFTECLIVIMAYRIVVQKTGFRPQLGILGKSLIAALVMGVIISQLHSIHVLLATLIGAICYVVVLYLLKGIDQNFMRILKPKQS